MLKGERETEKWAGAYVMTGRSQAIQQIRSGLRFTNCDAKKIVPEEAFHAYKRVMVRF